MDLQRLAKTDFVLLQATWPVEKSCHLIEQLKPSHIMVHRRDPQDLYYLFATEYALDLLIHAKNDSSVHEALNLHEYTATSALEGSTDAEVAPYRCVVLEDGYPIGFVDASIPPQYIPWRRGEDHRLESIVPELEHRSLVAELPDKVPLHETFSLLVSLSSSSLPETGAVLPIVLPLGATVDILVQPRQGLVLEGRREGKLVISSEEETLPLRFELRAVALGPGQLRVLAFHQGQPLGAITLRVTVLAASTNIAMQHHSQKQPLDPVNFHQPDLSLLILEHWESGEPAFTFRLHANDPSLELNFKPFGPVRLKVDALQYFQEFFDDIETLPFSNSREKAMAERRLATKGVSLFESLIPADLQVLLWSLRSRIQLVQVQSEEPWVPWELCKLSGQENGQVVEGPFLCEAFALTRWIPGIAMKPSLKLNNMAVVVPANSGLAFTPDELAYLLSLSDGHRKVSSIPAKFLELYEALTSGKYDGWHFSGHGKFRGFNPNKSVIYLENQEIPFTPEDLSGKLAGNLKVTKPFVFLNACQIGRSAMSLTDIGGWARQFLRAGASAFIGAYWSVYDKPAYDFAQALYNRLLGGLPIGKAVQEARAVIRPAGDPTWLAYTVFADPLAVVQEDLPLQDD